MYEIIMLLKNLVFPT